MTAADDIARYTAWSLMVATGAGLSWIDRRGFGAPVFGILLCLLIAGGFLATNVSPFNFAGTGYFMEGVIAIGAGALALAGYVTAVGLAYLLSRRSQGRS